MRLAKADARIVTQRGPVPRVSRRVSVSLAGRPRRQRGFSLLEMLAVVVLIAIALTAVSMSVSKSLSSAKVRAVSRDLVAALRYTRGQAIVKGEQKTFDVDLEAMTYSAPGKEPQKFPDGIEVRVLTAAQEATSERKLGIRFFPDGSSTGGNIGVHSGEREWRVNVEWLTGEVALDEVRQ
jgi:general secretion pathway protein H